MLVKKKDWQELTARVSEVEKESKTWMDRYNQLSIQHYEYIDGLGARTHELEALYTKVKRDYDSLRDMLYSFFGKVKDVCADSHIYSESEKDNMSSEEFKHKILLPMLHEVR